MSGNSGRAPDDISKPAVAAKSDAREYAGQFDPKPTFTELRNERFEDQSRHLRREHWLRLIASAAVFVFVLGWLLFVAVVTVLTGVGYLKDLSEKVLIALFATTTVTVVGLLAAVVRYLFPINPAIFGQDTLPTTRAAKHEKRTKKT